ncbi:hypothetical protein PUNSTDRAFT_144383 [Punctularia strigosozonata HHB-11173 SS5]|uniref:uncharacterized protein n=1 Tax=Punctularia strigosozonata (strain HHB-11173) TaxID=741275 RepID=UPI0004418089|nr:uncharacterized protein PUNSTDRAFT_144383 [Punctularia strigosozonata HHB-11173 SS5]EIN07889.1 hypothetical protein PUNSTDRAFT_144383 [Punctularia strigosozonata HHB-11173 SS5]
MRAQSFDVPPSDDYGGEIFDGPSNDEDEDAGEIPKRHQEEGVTPTQHAPVRDRDKVRATSAHIWSQEPRSSATERTLLDVTFSASQLAQSTPRGPLSQSDDTSLLDSFVQTQEPTPPPSGLDGDAAVDVEAETSGLDDTDLHPVKSGTHVIPTTKAHKYRETRVVAGENIHTENGSGAHAQRELSVAPTAETDAFTDFSRSPTVTTQLRQPELSLTTPSRPSFSQKRAPREAPYFEEGPYINALTDARRRSRFSSGKRRASGVDDEDYERATEHSKTVAEGHVSEWPPRRKKRKVKAASSERETTPTGVDGRSHVAAPPSSHSAKGKERILGEPEQERLRAQIIGTQPVSNIRNLSTPHAEISSSEKPVFGERDAEEALASTESVDLDDIMDDGGSSADEVLDVLGDPEEDEETDQEPLQESELDEALLSTTHNAGPFGKPGLAPTPSYTERALQRYTEAHRLEAAAVSSAERASERGGFPKRRSTVSSGYLGAAREPPLGLAPSHAPLPGRLQFDGHPASDPPRGRRLSRHLREQAGDDPFLDESQGSPDLDVSGRRQARHRRRQTFGGFSAAEQIPYIDLLAALAREKVTYRRSSVRSSPARRTSGWLHAPLSSAHSSFASGRSSPASRSSVDDLTYMQRVGYETVMARIAETHGFHVNVVKRVHARTNDLGKTEQVIQRLKEFAEESVDKAFEDVEHYGSEPRSFVNMSFQRSHRSSSASRPPARRVSRRSDSPLKNSFLASREPSADDMSVGYTPPQATRAGDFLELSRQGRWKEALRREQRRASVVPPLPLRLSDGPSPNTTDTANRARSMEKTHPHSARRSEGWTTRRTWGATEDRLLASDDPEEALSDAYLVPPSHVDGQLFDLHASECWNGA